MKYKKISSHIYAKIEDKVKFIENNRKVHDVRTINKDSDIDIAIISDDFEDILNFPP